MRHLRALGRMVCLAAITAVASLLSLATIPVQWLSRSRGLRWQSGVIGLWGRAMVHGMGIDITTHGRPPRPPFFLVTNHLSYLDIIVLASRVPCFFVAKSDVAGWPLIGPIAASASTVFVDRDRRQSLPRALARIDEVMRSQSGMVFFPEGTSSAGDEVLPFRSSLFEAPLRAGYPVFCGSVHYETPPGEPPAGTAVCWWGDMTFGGHLYGLLQIPRVEASLRFEPDAVEGSNRKELARAAWTSVAAGLARSRDGAC